MFIEIRNNAIWFKQLEAEPALHDRLSALNEGEQIVLKVDNVEGRWVRMRTGRDGRPTNGIRPVGAMATVWARLQARRGQLVRLEMPGSMCEAYLVGLDDSLDEWLTAEDEEAFGDLRPV